MQFLVCNAASGGGRGAQASVNPKAETVEELQARRKNLHLGMCKLLLEDLANLTEQRMAEQMAILEKFYNHYDSQQWHAVIEMEGQVRDACAATLTCAAIMLNL